jgi:hypothetical protein
MLFHSGLIWCLSCNGQHKEAIACGRRALVIDQSFHLVWMAMGVAQLAAKLPDEAVHSFTRLMELTPWVHIAPGCLADAYHCAGDQTRGRELAAKFLGPGGLNIGSAISSCRQFRRCRSSIRTVRTRGIGTCSNG